MANMADLNFDANAVEPNKGFDLIPAGDYDAVIVASDRKETKAGDGFYLSLTFQILQGEHQNRKLWVNLNLWNRNEQAKQIAASDLSAICRAVNVLTVRDSSELHDKPLKIGIVQRKNKQTGELENRVSSYKPRHAAPVSLPQAAQNEVAAAATSETPW